MLLRNKIKKLTEEEKGAILRNAHTSFIHGVEHFTRYSESEHNIKFAILHIFNAVELLTKGYLGSININLLKRDIDDGGKDELKTRSADISVLLKRMKKFSEINFDDKLLKAIDELRNKRNDIEHKRFVLEKSEELLILLCQIINGLIVFSRNHLFFDICPDLITSIKKNFDDARMKLDSHFFKQMSVVDKLKRDGYFVMECPKCLNPSVPYKIESWARCFVCDEDVAIHKCERCGNLFAFKQGYPGVCEICSEADIKEMREIKNNTDETQNYPWDNLQKESY